MAYQSGDFQVPGAGSYAAPYGAAIFDSRLWLLGQSGSSMVQTTLQLVDNNGDGLAFETGAAKEASYWTTSALTIPGVSKAATTSRCGVAAVGDALHLFWNSTSEGGALRASRWTTTGNGQPGWQQALTLVAQGDPERRGLVVEGGAAVSAVGFGTDTVIVACSNVSAWWAHGPATLYIGTFNVADMNLENNTWQASSDIWGAPTPPFGPGYTFPTMGSAIAIDWFPASSGSDTTDPVPGTPPSYLWVSLASPSPSVGTSLILPVDAAGNVDYANGLHSTAPGGGAAVRDPAGRIRTYLSDPHASALDVGTYWTWDTPDPSNATSPLPSTPSQIAPAEVSTAEPAAAFFTDLTATGTQSVTYDGQSGSEYPVYEFVFYGQNQLRCQVNRFGTAQVFPNIPDPMQLQPNPAGSKRVIISGIIDGPIPIPNVNVANYKFQDSQPAFGDVTYSTTETGSTEHSVVDSFSAGFMTDGQTLKGWGPAWDVSFHGGVGSVKTDGTSTSLSTAKGQPAWLDTHSKRPNQCMLPGGSVFCSVATFHWTAYRFLDAAGNPVADGMDSAASQQAPLFTTVSCAFSDALTLSFVPYAVTPGDLYSYTPDGWNERMAALGYGPNYFEEVIEANAYPFTEDTNYLPMSWSAGGGNSKPTFQAATTDFTESSWSLDGSAYVGVSGGEGVSIFGVGVDWSFKFLVGDSFSHTASTSTTTGDEWGIGVSDPFGPPACFDGDCIAEYAFRVYFLPVPPPTATIPPNYWVKELKAYAGSASPFSGPLPFPPLDPDTIDENASAWKIVFVVTSYASSDGTNTYPPADVS
jgi:hypothetical protein